MAFSLEDVQQLKAFAVLAATTVLYIRGAHATITGTRVAVVQTCVAVV